MEVKTVLLRTPNDYLKVKKAMENKEPYVAVKFDRISVKNLNVQGMMNAIQDYLHIYGYKVKEYGTDKSVSKDHEAKGYLYERVID